MTTASTDALAPSTHLARLDVLRGIAVLMVFGYHLLGPAFGAFDLPWAGAGREGLVRTIQGVPAPFLFFAPLTLGWAGVSLFLLLSGFVIHYTSLPLLDARGQIAPGPFFRRRFFRLYPAYLAALIVYLALDVDHLLAKGAAKWLMHVGTHLFFLHNLSPGTFFSICGVFWSLALEVQLYLLYPLLLYLRARRGMTGALYVTLAVGLLARAVLLPLQNWGGELHPVLWQSTPVLWFDWTLGAFLAERFRRGDGPIRLPRGTIPALLITMLAALWTKPTYTVSFTLATLAFAVLLDREVHCTDRLSPLARVLGWFGLVSYSLYLWHEPLMKALLTPVKQFLLPRVGDGWASALTIVAGGSVALAVCAGVAFVSYRSLEQGGVALGKRWGARRAG